MLIAQMRTASEQRFETYLTDEGYEFEHEPELRTIKRPDYLIRRSGLEAVCEVKEFKTTAIRDHLEQMGGTAALSARLVFGAVRGQVDAAARQLKPLADGPRPLVVVLANPHGADVNLGAEHVVHALYGNPAVTFALDGMTGELSAACPPSLTAMERSPRSTDTSPLSSPCMSGLWSRIGWTMRASGSKAEPRSFCSTRGRPAPAATSPMGAGAGSTSSTPRRPLVAMLFGCRGSSSTAL